MSSVHFQTLAKGKTASDAFADATSQARYEHGHGGYTGTIAEKSTFREVGACPPSVPALRALAQNLGALIQANLRVLANDRAAIAAQIERLLVAVEAATTPLEQAKRWADLLLLLDDPRVAEKRGPAGCIGVEPGVYLFFGRAAS